MSYQLIDSAGHGADAASNQGLRELEAFGLPALKEFLTTGVADAAQMEQLIEEAKSEPKLKYLAVILSGMEPPVVLTDGVVESDENE